MKTFAIAIVCVVCVSGLSQAQAVPAAPAPSPRDLHVAQCVAALDVNTQDLAQQVKAGKKASSALLLDRLVSGAAFVGDAYLHGDSDEEQARQLTAQALQAQKSMSPAALAARQTACADEGAKLYSASNRLQQAVVKRLAKKRMEKLLAA